MSPPPATPCARNTPTEMRRCIKISNRDAGRSTFCSPTRSVGFELHSAQGHARLKRRQYSPDLQSSGPCAWALTALIPGLMRDSQVQARLRSDESLGGAVGAPSGSLRSYVWAPLATGPDTSPNRYGRSDIQCGACIGADMEACCAQLGARVAAPAGRSHTLWELRSYRRLQQLQSDMPAISYDFCIDSGCKFVFIPSLNDG